MTTFTDLGVLPEIVDALTSVGIESAFPIQEMTLSVALGGSDLIGQARTGTGKTLAFAIPVISHILTPEDDDYDTLVSPGKPQALIIAPTRELALQVSRDVELAAKNLGRRSLVIYGGVPYEPQLDALAAGVDIVVGTPGRVLDLINRRNLDISNVRSLVLDEADEMLDLGFLPDVEAILSHTPDSRQTMLFSATMPSAIVSLARKHLRQPINIRAESHEANQTKPDTTQFVWQAHDMDKPEIVARILQAEGVGRVIVFTRTKRAAQRLADDLADRGFPASPLHGDMAQKAREKAMQGFRDGKVDILVATDVAARGIDVSGITHVINYTCPEDDKTYVHRIGRTGRAGAKGIAVTFVDWADIQRWKLINKALELDFDDPVETYSTSDHLYSELGIDPVTLGSLKPASGSRPKTASSSTASSTDRPKRSGRSRGGADRAATSSSPANADTATASGSDHARGDDEQPKRSRNRRRRRTRGGSPVGEQSTSHGQDAQPAQ